MDNFGYRARAALLGEAAVPDQNRFWVRMIDGLGFRKTQGFFSLRVKIQRKVSLPAKIQKNVLHTG